MENAKYLMDTSVFNRRKSKDIYDEEAFPIHWRNFDYLVEQGLVISILEVKEELERKVEIFKFWVKDHEDIFKPLDNNSVVLMNKINSDYPKLYEANNKKKSIADIPLVAFAKTHNLVLVTQESYNYNPDTNEKKYTIPTLCELEGAKCTVENCQTDYSDENYDFECIDFVELVKRERLFDPDLFEDTMNDV